MLPWACHRFGVLTTQAPRQTEPLNALSWLRVNRSDHADRGGSAEFAFCCQEPLALAEADVALPVEYGRSSPFSLAS